MSKEEICLERKICALLHNKKDCKSCKQQFYINCEEWGQMKEIKNIIIKEVVKRIEGIW